MDKLGYRHIHLDFHTSPLIPGIGEKFDKKEFQEALKRAHVDSITLTAKCHHGYAYYPSEVNEMHPGLKFDLIKAEMDACREIGVKTPLYLSAGFDEKEAVKHLSWLVRFSADYPINFLEDARYHCLCFNTPYFDRLYNETKELMERYNPEFVFFDIVDIRPCHCNSCVAGMREKGMNPHDENDVMKYGREVFLNFTSKLNALIHSYNKDAEIFYNAGRVPMNDREFLEPDTHIELEGLPTGGWGYDHFPTTASYVRNLGKEYVGMTARFHRSWAEFGGYKHPNALKYETSLFLALGAKCCIGDQLHPSGKVDFPAADLIGSAYSEVEKKEEFCRGAESVADIGILSYKASIGAGRIMLESNFLYDFIDTDCNFSKYKLIILPDNIYLTDKLTPKLKEYLKNGGKILASGCSGFDADGKFLGNDYLKLGEQNEFYPNYMHPLSPDGFTNGIAGYLMENGSFKFEYDDSFKLICTGADSYFNRTPDHFSSHFHTAENPDSKYPGAVISDNIGYICWNIFVEYQLIGPLHCKELVTSMINALLGENKTLKVKNLPDRGVVTLMNQKAENRMINHLLFAHTTNRGSGTEIIEDIVPVYDIEVEIKSDKEPTSIYFEPEHTPLEYKYENGIIKYTVPKLYIHQMVVINY